MTAEELFLLPDDGFRHELLRGELLSFPYNGEEHGFVASNVAWLLGSHVRRYKLGRLFIGVGCLIEIDPDTVLAPDIAFDRGVRALSDSFHSGAPNLVVEVLSINDQAAEVDERTDRWLRGGAESVWLVDCKSRTVEIRGSNGEHKTFREDDQLVDDDIVVGFRVQVSEVFTD